MLIKSFLSKSIQQTQKQLLLSSTSTCQKHSTNLTSTILNQDYPLGGPITAHSTTHKSSHFNKHLLSTQIQRPQYRMFSSDNKNGDKEDHSEAIASAKETQEKQIQNQGKRKKKGSKSKKPAFLAKEGQTTEQSTNTTDQTKSSQQVENEEVLPVWQPKKSSPQQRQGGAKKQPAKFKQQAAPQGTQQDKAEAQKEIEVQEQVQQNFEGFMSQKKLQGQGKRQVGKANQSNQDNQLIEQFLKNQRQEEQIDSDDQFEDHYLQQDPELLKEQKEFIEKLNKNSDIATYDHGLNYESEISDSELASSSDNDYAFGNEYKYLGKGQKSRIKHILGSSATDTDDITLATKLERDYFNVVESESSDEMSTGSDEVGLSNESGADSLSEFSGNEMSQSSGEDHQMLAQSSGSEQEISGQEQSEGELNGEELQQLTMEEIDELRQLGALDEEVLDELEHKDFFERYVNAEDEFKEDQYYKDMFNAQQRKIKLKLDYLKQAMQHKRQEYYLPGQKDNMINIEKEVFDPKTFEGKGEFKELFEEMKESIDQEQKRVDDLIQSEVNETRKVQKFMQAIKEHDPSYFNAQESMDPMYEQIKEYKDFHNKIELEKNYQKLIEHVDPQTQDISFRIVNLTPKEKNSIKQVHEHDKVQLKQVLESALNVNNLTQKQVDTIYWASRHGIGHHSQDQVSFQLLVNQLTNLSKDSKWTRKDVDTFVRLIRQQQGLETQAYEGGLPARREIREHQQYDQKVRGSTQGLLFDKKAHKKLSNMMAQIQDLKKKDSLTAEDKQVLSSHVYSYLKNINKKYFDKNLLQVLKDLKLEDNLRFNTLMQELLLNHTDLKSGKNVILDKFMVMTVLLSDPQKHCGKQYLEESPQLHKRLVNDLEFHMGLHNKKHQQGYNLINNPEFMIKLELVSLARNSNFFGTVDRLMKYYAKCLSELENLTPLMNLQNALNSEIALKTSDKPKPLLSLYNQTPLTDIPVPRAVIGQQDFQFQSLPMKLYKINEYRKLRQEQSKMVELMQLFDDSMTSQKIFDRMTDDPKSFFELIDNVNQIDDLELRDWKIENHPVYHKLKNVTYALNEQITQFFLQRFEIDNINSSNMTSLYDPHVSGFATMAETRHWLVSKGMTNSFADHLAMKYLQQIEEFDQYKIVNVMDLFDNKKDNYETLKVLMNNNFNDIVLNYQTRDQYRQDTNSHLYKFLMQRNLGALKTLNKDPRNALTQNHPQVVRAIRPKAAGITQSMRQFSTVTEAKKMEGEGEKQQESGHLEEMFQIDSEDIQFSSDISGKNSRLQDVTSGIEQHDEQQQEGIEQLETEAQEEQIQYTQAEMERIQFLRDACDKYNIQFFKQFSYNNDHQMRLSQKALEEHIQSIEDPKDLQMLFLSMIHQAYDLNAYIPNIELVLYNIFMTPITTAELKKQSEDKDDLLVGNLFAKNKIPLGSDAYKSICETMTLRPKKKNLKRLIQYIDTVESKETMDKEVIDRLVHICIDQRYPILLGKTVKNWIQQGYKIKPSTISEVLQFLDKCKGFEEDAMRFISMISDLNYMQLDYNLVRKIFQKSIVNRQNSHVLKIFEQFRKNIKLHIEDGEQLSQEEKFVKLKDIKDDFYEKLLQDLLDKDKIHVASIVYDERKKEKFDLTIKDQLIGLRISASQKDEQETTKFVKFLMVPANNPDRFNNQILAQIIDTLRYFDFEDHQEYKDKLTIFIAEHMFNCNQRVTGAIFDDLVKSLVQKQEWRKLCGIINMANKQNLEPNLGTSVFIKKQMLHCFSQGDRMELKSAMQQFDQQFFAKDKRYQQMKQKDEQKERDFYGEASGKKRRERTTLLDEELNEEAELEALEEQLTEDQFKMLLKNKESGDKEDGEQKDQDDLDFDADEWYKRNQQKKLFKKELKRVTDKSMDEQLIQKDETMRGKKFETVDEVSENDVQEDFTITETTTSSSSDNQLNNFAKLFKVKKDE